ncbi:His-Xaa-Ser system-associated MauG-like protein [Spongiibacter tropicus]|uniref:His-Xaa-Ser system-associated MauG-like protein n=1 Tax=Spongiibacter tropicus TaxID=454602 RepID=UPI0035BE5EE0
MKSLTSFLSTVALLLLGPSTLALDIDKKLELVIQVHQLQPARCIAAPSLIEPALNSLGEAVFTTNILSGDRDVSCSTCHLDKAALTDGLSLSVGVGGVGEGVDRLYSKGVIVPRNAFTLFGRAHPDFTTFFWDGKVLEKDGVIFSPIGEGESKGFRSALAVAAVLPILARDEFLGKLSPLDENPNISHINSSYYEEKIQAANAVLNTILNSQEPDAKKLKQAFMDSGAPHFDLALVGNALASFIATKLQKDCTPSAWEQYLAGNRHALTRSQKDGALLFYGKGRCAACHSGSLQTDFSFHSIGSPQGEFGTHIHGQDIGRAGVTYESADRFQFRTPPLFYVSETAPYGHNGIFPTLEDVVTFHLNPLLFMERYPWATEKTKFTYNKVLTSRSALLGYIEISSEEELGKVLDFLSTF